MPEHPNSGIIFDGAIFDGVSLDGAMLDTQLGSHNLWLSKS
jgi:hypothetical protein